ncbi:MAG: sugar nucleotidyltransferase [Candidatus Krumholzibacteriia bacterium]
MKALIPAAGIGTRLRPHTLNKPKALLPVAGKPILAHIVDDLRAAGIDEFVIVVGFEGEAVRAWFRGAYPGVPVTFIEQPERLGLGHAVWTAREAIGAAPFFCILGDTILKADYAALLGDPANCIAVREVADPRRFGVVELRDGRVVRFVEKPERPPSNLAIVGAYLLRDAAALWAALSRLVREDRRTRGEYQLTDALQLMVEQGLPFDIVAVSDWYDCGKPETWLETNRVLLDRQPGRAVAGVEGPCAIAPDAVVTGSRLGPYVSIGPGAVIVDSDLADCVVGPAAEVRDCHLRDSLVGARAVVRGARGRLNVGDYCEVVVGDA